MKFMIEKQINQSMAFLDVFVLGINNQNLTLQIYDNQPIQAFFKFLRVLRPFHIRLVELNV